MKACLIKFVMGFLIIAETATAQFSVLPLDTVYNYNFLNTDLVNDINLASLNSILNYSGRHKRFGITVGNYYLSNVSKFGQNFYTDYNNFKLILSYALKRNLEAGLGFQNKFYTDDKNVKTNKNNSSYYFLNTDYFPQRNLRLNSRLGFKLEDQIGEFNKGFSGILTAEGNNLSLDSYIGDGYVTLFYENLIQKQNHNYEINSSLYKRFTSETDNTGSIRYYNQRNDIYSPATPSVAIEYNVRNNIEKRIENYFRIGDNLNYLINPNLNLSLSGFFVNRIITRQFKYLPSTASILFENVYDTKILENNLVFAADLNFNWNRIISQFRMIYDERSENHSLINVSGLNQSQISELKRAEKNKNNNSRRTSALIDFNYLYSNTNTLGLTGSTSLLRYDTDFEENYDDRDELESIISAYHRYDNLINFHVQTRFEIILSKLSYIFSQKSANNYRNRIYKLSSESYFKPAEKFTTRNYVQVLANYTVYDYEDIVSQVQSFSYRQLYIRDSSAYNLTKNLSLDFNAELKFYEQGQFNNSNFSVKPVAYYAEQFYLPGINYFVNKSLLIGIGYKFFSQRRYQYENSEKRLANVYSTYGPLGKIILYLYNNSIINFTGGYDIIKYQSPPQSNSSVNLQFNVNWNI